MLKNNLDKIHWKIISYNKNKKAIQLIKDTIKINKDIKSWLCWYGLSSNINASDILENNLDKVNWNKLSSNPGAMKIIKNNLNKISWGHLTENPNP